MEDEFGLPAPCYCVIVLIEFTTSLFSGIKCECEHKNVMCFDFDFLDVESGSTSVPGRFISFKML